MERVTLTWHDGPHKKNNLCCYPTAYRHVLSYNSDNVTFRRSSTFFLLCTFSLHLFLSFCPTFPVVFLSHRSLATCRRPTILTTLDARVAIPCTSHRSNRSKYDPSPTTSLSGRSVLFFLMKIKEPFLPLLKKN